MVRVDRYDGDEELDLFLDSSEEHERELDRLDELQQ